MTIALIALLLAAQAPENGGIGTIINPRGAGLLSCATAFLPENRVATANWIAGYWVAWDMAQIRVAKPLAGGSDLNGIVGEVERVCRQTPSSSLWGATTEARNEVKAREEGPPR